ARNRRCKWVSLHTSLWGQEITPDPVRAFRQPELQSTPRPILIFPGVSIIWFDVGPHRSRPAYPRHFAQALHLARWSGRGHLAESIFPTSPNLAAAMEKSVPPKLLY